MHQDLMQVEPFTVIILQQDSLYECRWDGSKKHCSQLPKHRSYIWSSVTLYDEDMIKKREQWFVKWLNSHPNPNQEDILHFHQFGGEGDTTNDLVMNRKNCMLTVSITGMELGNEISVMTYKDLKTGKAYKKELRLHSETPAV